LSNFRGIYGRYSGILRGLELALEGMDCETVVFGGIYYI